MTAAVADLRLNDAAVGRRRWDSVSAAGLLVLVVLGLFVGLRLLAHRDLGLSAFVLVGNSAVQPDALPPGLHPLPSDQGPGYDGQFAYRLALDPFTHAGTAHGLSLGESPAYRQQRIGYPLATWVVSHATGLPTLWALVLVNLAAMVAIACLAAAFVSTYGRHRLWGAAIALSPALLIGFARDLTGPLAWAFVLAGLVLWRRNRVLLAALAFCAAVLTRETTLVVPAGLGVWEAWCAVRRHPRWDSVVRCAALLLGPLAVYLAWRWHLAQVWNGGKVGVIGGEEAVGVPVLSMLRTLLGSPLDAYAAAPARLRAAWGVEHLALFAFLGYSVAQWRRTRLPMDLRITLLLGLVIASSVPWLWDAQFFRAANEATMLGMLMLVAVPGRRGTAGLGGMAVLGAFIGSVFAVNL